MIFNLRYTVQQKNKKKKQKKSIITRLFQVQKNVTIRAFYTGTVFFVFCRSTIQINNILKADKTSKKVDFFEQKQRVLSNPRTLTAYVQSVGIRTFDPIRTADRHKADNQMAESILFYFLFYPVSACKARILGAIFLLNIRH